MSSYFSAQLIFSYREGTLWLVANPGFWSWWKCPLTGLWTLFGTNSAISFPIKLTFCTNNADNTLQGVLGLKKRLNCFLGGFFAKVPPCLRVQCVRSSPSSSWIAACWPQHPQGKNVNPIPANVTKAPATLEKWTTLLSTSNLKRNKSNLKLVNWGLYPEFGSCLV